MRRICRMLVTEEHYSKSGELLCRRVVDMPDMPADKRKRLDEICESLANAGASISSEDIIKQREAGRRRARRPMRHVSGFIDRNGIQVLGSPKNHFKPKKRHER